MAALNKYEVLLTSGKYNAMSSKQEHISVKNFHCWKTQGWKSKSFQVCQDNQQERQIKEKKSQSNNNNKKINGKGNGKGKKERHILPQDK